MKSTWRQSYLRSAALEASISGPESTQKMIADLVRAMDHVDENFPNPLAHCTIESVGGFDYLRSQKVLPADTLIPYRSVRRFCPFCGLGIGEGIVTCICGSTVKTV